MERLLQISLCTIFIVSFILPGISCSMFLQEKKVGVIKTFCVNVFITLMLHCFLRKHLNVWYTLKQLWLLEWTYDEIIDLTNLFSVSLMFFCVLNFILCVRREKYRREKKIVKIKIGILFLISMVVNLAGYCAVESSNNKLVINEVASKNTKEYLLQNEEYCDYIEFYNKGNLIFEVKDLYVSDDINNLKKIELAECRIRPGEYLLLGLDQKNNTHCIKNNEKIIWYSPEYGSNGLQNESFVISELGEYVYLSDRYGNILDEVYTEKQTTNISYARIEDGQDEWQFQTYTPGESNSTGYKNKEVVTPKLSHSSGFYDSPFELEIFGDKDTNIYYTIDGSDPIQKGILYTHPIYVYDRSMEKNIWNSVRNVVADWKNYVIDETPVDKAFIIKVVAKDKNEKAISETVCATFFIDKNEYKDKNVISLIADPNDLFGDDGIFVTGKEYDTWYLEDGNGLAPGYNWNKRGRKSEVNAEFEMFKEKIYIKDSIGIRVQGGGRRENAKKGISILARKEYGGSKWLKGTLFNNYKIHSLQLRSGEANAILHYLVRDRYVDTQESESVVLFLNGEFWENTYVQENLSESYLEAKYGLEDNNIMLVKNSGRVGDEYSQVPSEYQQIYDFLENEDLANEEVYKKFKEIVDINSYIDFSCINIYCANMDWAEDSNYVMWRVNRQEQTEYGDGKWRWVLYDLDAVEWNMTPETYGVPTRELINPFTMAGPFTAGQSYSETRLYMALRKNAAFCQQMVTTFMDLINHNFSVENVDKVFSEWGLDSTWNDSFFIKRLEPMIEYIREEFDLKGNVETIEVQVNDNNGGTIRVNSIIPNLDDNSWSGRYFTDYPVEIEAYANEGYKFVKWSGDNDSKEQKIQVEMKDGGIKIAAIFEKD